MRILINAWPLPRDTRSGVPLFLVFARRRFYSVLLYIIRCSPLRARAQGTSRPKLGSAQTPSPRSPQLLPLPPPLPPWLFCQPCFVCQECRTRIRPIRRHCDVVSVNTEAAILLVQRLQGCHVRSTLNHLVGSGCYRITPHRDFHPIHSTHLDRDPT